MVLELQKEYLLNHHGDDEGKGSCLLSFVFVFVLFLVQFLTWVSRVPVVNLIPGFQREKWVLGLRVMIRVRVKG
jgi:hypothetical protein